MQQKAWMHRSGWLAPLAILLASAAPVAGAEVQIRKQCQPASGLVTLGDCAEIHATDSNEKAALAAIELLPAPPAGQIRLLRVREIQDLLLLRGINLVEHRFSGSGQVTIQGPSPRPATQPLEPLTPALTRRVERQMREGVLAYLEQVAGAENGREVQFVVGDDLARRVHEAAGATVIRGGEPPWSGLQRLEVAVGSEDASERFALNVRIETVPSIVVTTHSLPRGAVITAADVAMQQGSAGHASADCFRSVEHVIGSETTQAIGEGAVIASGMVRTPRLVRRGEIVTVYARSGGIRVRTVARARDDGSLNDLIGVETLAERKAFFARVSGIRELEIYARSAHAATAAGQVMME